MKQRTAADIRQPAGVRVPGAERECLRSYVDLSLQFEDGRIERRRCRLPAMVGRGTDCAIVLRSWRVARHHALLQQRQGLLWVEDQGSLLGTIVNDRRVGLHGPIGTEDEIVIGPCLLRLVANPSTDPEDAWQHEAQGNDGTADLPSCEPHRKPDSGHHVLNSEHHEPNSEHHQPESRYHQPESRHHQSDLPRNRPDLGLHHSGLPYLQPDREHGQAGALGDGVGDPPCGEPGVVCDGADAIRGERPAQHHLGAPADEDMQAQRPGLDLSQESLAHRRRLHTALLGALQLERRDISAMSDATLKQEASDILAGLIAQDTDLPATLDRDVLIRGLVDEAVGLGPLEPLLADPEVSEIMVNRHDEVYVERRGRLVRQAAGFSSDRAVMGIIERIVSPLGRRIDDGSPMVDARLPDGSRVNAVIAPISLRGPSLTIRKFPARRLAMSDLLAAGALDEHMSIFLDYCVRQRRNIIVSGGTGSGKTSLLNILSNAIPAGERIVTIEDAAELRLNHAHLVSLEARPPNLEGRGRVEIRDLVRNALRMRPDRIVVGECRGSEAFDMLAAMNTGHEGSLTTLHANSPRDALARLETLVLMAGMDLPLAAVREHIASSVNVIVQLARCADGRRLLTSIVEVTGMEGNRIQLQELFVGNPGPPARFSGCGILPMRFSADTGLDVALFNQQTVWEAGHGRGQDPDQGTSPGSMSGLNFGQSAGGSEGGSRGARSLDGPFLEGGSGSAVVGAGEGRR